VIKIIQGRVLKGERGSSGERDVGILEFYAGGLERMYGQMTRSANKNMLNQPRKEKKLNGLLREKTNKEAQSRPFVHETKLGKGV